MFFTAQVSRGGPGVLRASASTGPVAWWHVLTVQRMTDDERSKINGS